MAPNPLKLLRFARDHRWTQRHMSDYLDGDLADDDRRRADRHLRECPECHALLASLRVVLVKLGGVRRRPERPVADSILAGVHERLGEQGADEQPL